MSGLSGNLQSVDLANIFQMLALNQREGTLHIKSEGGAKAIYFSRDGVQMLSTGQENPEDLCGILLRFDKLTPERLQDVLGRQAPGDKRFVGQVLIDQGLITRDDVEAALRTQIEEEIFKLFIWKDAEFEFVEGTPDAQLGTLDGSTKLTFNVNSIIMEAARRLDEWEWIEEVVSSLHEIYDLTGTNMELDDSIFEEPWAGKVLGAVDGHNSVLEIIEHSYVNKFDVCKIINLLARGEAIAPATPTALTETFRLAVQQNDWPAASKFTKRLASHKADTPEIHMALAKLLEVNGEYAAATHHFKDYAESQVGLGAIAKAFETYLRVLDLVPTDLEAGSRMTELFTERPSELEQHRGTVTEWCRHLATIYSELTMHRRAVVVLQRVVALAPEDGESRNRLVQAYLAAGMNDEAIEEMESLADAALAADNPGRAETMYRSILSVDANRRDIRSQLDRLLARKQKRRASWRTFSVGSMVIVGLALLSWVGIDQYMRWEASRQAREDEAMTAFNAVAETYKGVAPRLSQITQPLLDVRQKGELERLPDVFAEHKAERVKWRKEVEVAITAYKKVADTYPDTVAGSERVNGSVGQLRVLLEKFNRLDPQVQDACAERAEQLFLDAQRSVETREGTRTQLAAWGECLRFGRVSPTWLDNERGLEALGWEKSLGDTIAAFEATVARVRELTEAGRTDDAFDLGMEFLTANARTDLAFEIELPIQFDTIPTNALVSIGTDAEEMRTPQIVTIKPWIGAKFVLKAPGFTDVTYHIRPVDGRTPEKILDQLPRARVAALQRKQLWESPELIASIQAAPVAVGDLVVVPIRSSEMPLLSITDGEQVDALVVGGLDGLKASPFFTNGTLVAPLYNKTVHFFNLRTRKSEATYEAPGPLSSDGLLIGKRVYLVDEDGHVVCVDLTTRREVWRYQVPRGPGAKGFVCSPRENSGYIYAACANDKVYVLAPENGRLVREVRVPGGDGGAARVRWIEADADGLFTAGGDGFVRRLDRNGEEVWKFDTRSGLASAPILLPERVLLVTRAGRIQTLRLTDGQVLGEHNLDKAVGAPAAFDRATAQLVIGDKSGAVTLLNVKDEKPTVQWIHRIDERPEGPVEITARPVFTKQLVLVGGVDKILRAISR